MTGITLKFPSAVLMRPVEVHVLVPFGLAATRPPYRVVWALHCAMEGGEFFLQRLDAATLVQETGIALVAPSLGNGFFLNSATERQADFLDELKDALPELLPLSTAYGDNAVLGISMGGFGAVRWAWTSAAFAYGGVISGVFDCRVPPDAKISQERRQKNLYTALSGILRGLTLDEAGAPKDTCDFSRLASETISHAPVHLYCGDRDYISLPQTAYMEKICTEHDLPVSLHISPGAHDVEYWKKAFYHAVRDNFAADGE